MKSYVQEEREWFAKSLDEGPIPSQQRGSSLLTLLATEKLTQLRRQHSRPIGQRQFKFLLQEVSQMEIFIDGFPVFAVEMSFHSDPLRTAVHLKGVIGDDGSYLKPRFRFSYLKQL